MSETSETGDAAIAVDRQSPEAVFALLGDDIRLSIVSALGETPDEAVAFGDLRERVGVSDSGQFNYHLRKLRDTFVRKTDAGYELTYAGRQVLGAMHAGTYTANATVDPFPVEGACPLCGAEVLAAYADETATLTCSDCDGWENTFTFPPGSLDQFDREELPGAFDRWMGHVFDGVVAGFCYTCTGRMTGELVADDEPDRVAGVPAHVRYECGRCGSTARASGVMPALFHPAVQGFLYEHGFDTRTDPSWSLVDTARPDAELVGEDPLRLRVRFDQGGETVEATVDATASVTEVQRRPA
ncbi:ArsR/SmtB family transcription factor [Halorarius halobius]|uniref:ArsR/SmtB family transcription factor n=1 Tax=Halorarius halobius TaxID=2962671 RepID=UPI0020CF8881|nr:helix-turn-helix domain-containing protein [Halorarius halobius]